MCINSVYMALEYCYKNIQDKKQHARRNCIVVRTVGARIQCTIRSCVYHIIYVSIEHSQVTIQYGQFIIIINYVNKHQLSPAIDASHTTPTSRINWGPILLKPIGWRYSPYCKWDLYIRGTTAQIPGAEPGRTVRYYSNSNSTHSITVEQQNNDR